MIKKKIFILGHIIGLKNCALNFNGEIKIEKNIVDQNQIRSVEINSILKDENIQKQRNELFEQLNQYLLLKKEFTKDFIQEDQNEEITCNENGTGLVKKIEKELDYFDSDELDKLKKLFHYQKEIFQKRKQFLCEVNFSIGHSKYSIKLILKRKINRINNELEENQNQSILLKKHSDSIEFQNFTLGDQYSSVQKNTISKGTFYKYKQSFYLQTEEMKPLENMPIFGQIQDDEKLKLFQQLSDDDIRAIIKFISN